MSPGFSLIAFLLLSVLKLTCGDGGGHHHHVIIHVPYKIHTIHHTIMKHIHHHDKGGEDKYEVLGYTVGKPLDLGHHLGGGGGGGGGGGDHHLFQHHQPQQEHDFGGGDQLLHQHHQHQELDDHDFSGGNELGHGQDWTPSFGHHNFASGGGGGYAAAPETHEPPSHEYVGHGSFHGYD